MVAPVRAVGQPTVDGRVDNWRADVDERRATVDRLASGLRTTVDIEETADHPHALHRNI